VSSPLARALGPVCLAIAAACTSGPQLRSDSEQVATSVELARQAGAVRCAPRELATAEANLDFARAELASGDSLRAAEHLSQAKAAAAKALSLSTACAEKPQEPLVVKVADGDRDGDGIPDSIDRCPDEPEDYDGFQDDDGCPDRDNDNDGVPDAEDRCPNTPGPRENFGCPILDRDGDGIPDHLDKCPDEPEDYDGFQDEDGCPDPDNDRDGVPDIYDKCPNTPGPAENFGCPAEYKRVVVKEDRIEIKQQIRFRPGSAKMASRESLATLKEVAQALRDNARIKKLRIEGHTDSVGGDATNLKLSQARADAVREQLIRDGVEPSRLEAVGYGKTRPIASNTTAAGRAKNRRTEFNIIEQ
jgi:outer membrane protein OmpA-like peptidoglycan-associated protein